jgi:peptidoglycan/LPS O-acetylase OafA/YrhL
VLALALGRILLPLDIPGREAVFVNPLSQVLDVVVGVTQFHVYRLLKARFPHVGRGTATLIEVGALLLLALVIGVNYLTTWIKPWEDVINWLLPQGTILVVLALLDGQEGLIGRVLLWRPLQWLGSISFEVYVLQFVVFHLFGFVVAPAMGHFGLNLYNHLAWFALPLLLPLAWVVNRWFTRPLNAYFHRRLTTKGLKTKD